MGSGSATKLQSGGVEELLHVEGKRDQNNKEKERGGRNNTGNFNTAGTRCGNRGGRLINRLLCRGKGFFVRGGIGVHDKVRKLGPFNSPLGPTRVFH